jgi:branched-chain amino acid transport system ATP-binding protein
VSAVLTLRGLVAGHGDVPVVHGLDLSVSEGEVVALLGPNGAGKTTTLLTVSGLLRPLGGQLELFGEPCPPPRRRRAEVGRRARAGLAHVPEDRSLFPGLTVAQNLSLGAPWRGSRAAVERGVELFPALDGLRDRRAGLLSGGEQQMLAIARALVGSPRVVMIDELSLGLAPKVVAELLPVLRRVADERGTAFLLVEQHVPMVLGVADRAVVLAGGHVRLSGTAAELAGDPSVVASAYLGG